MKGTGGPAVGANVRDAGVAGVAGVAAPDRRGWTFWVALALGWGVIAFGVRGLLHEHLATNPTASVRLILVLAVLHDLVVAPLVFGAGLVILRLVPKRAQSLVQGGLIVSATVAVFSYPFVRGYGRAATNPSALPVNYARGLLVILTVVWLVVGVLVALRYRPEPYDRDASCRKPRLCGRRQRC